MWMVEITTLGLEVFDDVHVNALSIADDLVAHLKSENPNCSWSYSPATSIPTAFQIRTTTCSG